VVSGFASGAAVEVVGVSPAVDHAVEWDGFEVVCPGVDVGLFLGRGGDVPSPEGFGGVGVVFTLDVQICSYRLDDPIKGESLVDDFFRDLVVFVGDEVLYEASGGGFVFEGVFDEGFYRVGVCVLLPCEASDAGDVVRGWWAERQDLYAKVLV